MSKTLEETTKEIARVALLLGDVPGVMWSALAALERYPAHEYEARTLAQSRDTLLAGLRSLRILALAPAPSTTRAPEPAECSCVAANPACPNCNGTGVWETNSSNDGE